MKSINFNIISQNNMQKLYVKIANKVRSWYELQKNRVCFVKAGILKVQKSLRVRNVAQLFIERQDYGSNLSV